MCLAALALRASPRFPLVVAANRDEFFDRPAAPLDWWTPAGQAAPLLAGRDLLAGGTWMGLSGRGRLAIVTNVRQGGPTLAQGPSRGLIVPAWLGSPLPPEPFMADPGLGRRAPFNLVAADLSRGEAWWCSNLADAPRRLGDGLTVLSNAASLAPPWPKVRRLRAGVASVLENGEPASADELADALFALLADRTPADDAELPSTGLPLARERLLAPAFIVSPDGRYGTRCSTLVVTERRGGRHTTRVWERSFGPAGEPGTLRQVTLPDWPAAG